MKLPFEDNRKRIIAWICTVVVVLGSAGAVLYTKSKKQPDNSTPAQNFSVKSNKSDNNVISAGGTVESEQLCDYLGFESTSLRLKIDEVYVESGDKIEEGTAVYKITAESLEKAEKTLTTELQSAESKLLNQKMQYTKDKNSAYALYQSELLSGDNAEATLSNGLSSLDNDLQKALESYTDAKNIVNNYPTTISNKESELKNKQNEADSCQQRINDLQNELNQKKEVYNSALKNYNEAVSVYNAAAGTVQFIGNSIGIDVSGVQLTGIAESIQLDNGNMNNAPSDNGGMNNFPSDKGDMNNIPLDRGNMNMVLSDIVQDFSSNIISDQSDSEISFDGDIENGANNNPENATVEKDEKQNALMELYNTAYSAYDEKKAKLTECEAEYKNAENEYKSCQNLINDYNTQLKNCQNDVSTLTKDISTLNSNLTQAKSNISNLESKYNSLKSSYDGDKIDLQENYDNDEASGNNAEYNYQITLATIEAELETAQNTYDTAENNLKIFKELLSDGIIKSQQSGTVYSVTYEQGKSVNINSPLIYYINEETYTTTVEVDQNDIIKINVGDEVTIYSSETGTETGTITSIVAGETTSLADVNFNVTIAANEDSNLYTGESVNVYFNSSGMGNFSFEDANTGEKGGNGESGGRPDFSGDFSDFSGGMPDGFDPSNMSQGGGRPDFANRKED